MYTLLTTVDVNDGDFFLEDFSLTDEDMEEMQRIISKLSSLPRNRSVRIEDYDNKGMKELYLKYITEKEFEIFMQYVPVPEPGYATLEKMEFFVGTKQLLARF